MTEEFNLSEKRNELHEFAFNNADNPTAIIRKVIVLRTNGDESYVGAT